MIFRQLDFMCREASGRRDKCAGLESDQFPPEIKMFRICFMSGTKNFIPHEAVSTARIHISAGGSPRGFSLYSKTPRRLGYPLETSRENPVMALLLVKSAGQYLSYDQLTFSFCFISRSLLRRLCSGSLLLDSISSVSSMSSSMTLLYLSLLFPRLDGLSLFCC